jgi:hypothetical protein
MRVRMVLSISAAVLALLVPQVAFGAYTSIAHNLLGGPGDTTYTSGVLHIYEANVHIPTLYVDSVALTGTVSEAVVDLSATYNHFDPTRGTYGTAVFAGGSFSLSFKYDGQPYSIGGPIDGMLVNLDSYTAGISKLVGEGRWTATTKNLPGDVWDDHAGFSSIHALTLEIGKDLRGFQWNTDIAGAGQTSYNIEPNAAAIPEPAGLVLLALGAVGLLRRRVA